MVSTWQVPRQVMPGEWSGVVRRLGGMRGSTCLQLLIERDELRSHVRLLLGRHGGQRRRRLVQLLLPRPELRQRLLRSAQATLEVGD